MAFNNSYASVLYVVLVIAITLGSCFGLLQVAKYNSSAAIRILANILIVVVFLGVPITSLIIWIKQVSFVVEIDNDRCTEYLVFGSCTLEASDGQQIVVSTKSNDYYMVNVTDRMLIEDAVYYGLGFDMGEGVEFPPHSYHIAGTEPDYFPWETPPDEISAPEGSFMKIQQWYYFRDEHRNQ